MNRGRCRVISAVIKMEKLNLKSTEIFSRLLRAMQGEQHLKINNEPFMPLTIEQIGEAISTPWGVGTLYSLCHYYEQNGDLMQDPEMCFVVVDNREAEATAWGQVVIVPYMFQQANLGIYQESVIIEDGKLTKFLRKMQADQTAFANSWLANIEAQGFLK